MLSSCRDTTLVAFMLCGLSRRAWGQAWGSMWSHTTSFPAEVPVRASVLLKWKTDWLKRPTTVLKVCRERSEALHPWEWLFPPQAQVFLLGPLCDIPSLSHDRAVAGQSPRRRCSGASLGESPSGNPDSHLQEMEGDRLQTRPLVFLRG